jgi:hypothetical protein
MALGMLSARSLDQTQPLDLAVFGNVKRFSLSPISIKRSRQSAQAIRMLNVWRGGKVARVVVAAIRAARFVTFANQGEMYLHIDRSEARRIRD